MIPHTTETAKLKNKLILIHEIQANNYLPNKIGKTKETSSHCKTCQINSTYHELKTLFIKQRQTVQHPTKKKYSIDHTSNKAINYQTHIHQRYTILHKTHHTMTNNPTLNIFHTEKRSHFVHVKLRQTNTLQNKHQTRSNNTIKSITQRHILHPTLKEACQTNTLISEHYYAPVTPESYVIRLRNRIGSNCAYIQIGAGSSDSKTRSIRSHTARLILQCPELIILNDKCKSKMYVL